MARPQLAALLEPRGDQPTTRLLEAPPIGSASEEPRAAEAPTAAETAAPAAEVTPKTPTAVRPPARIRRPRSSAPTEPPASQSIPPYLQFERKEARLRTDQLTSLNIRARQLNKTKDRDADRITDNTLIRVAVDLLLSRSDELAGGDEAALRRSLGLKH